MKLEENNGWIRVSDALPEKNKWVLTYDDSDSYNDGHYFVSYYDFTRKEKYKGETFEYHYFPDFQDEQPGHFTPSHWRPLPEPPEKK